MSRSLARCGLVVMLSSGALAVAQPAPANPTSSMPVASLADSAVERNSQSNLDFFTTGSRAALFSRPGFSEALKFSSEASTDGVSLSVGVTPASWFKAPAASLMSLQIQASHTLGKGTGTLGVKWNGPWRDPRTFSVDELGRIAGPAADVYRECIGTAPVTAPQVDKCLALQSDAQDEIVSRLAAKRLGVSIGGSSTWDFDAGRFSTLSANVALEYGIWELSLITNGDFQSDLNDAGSRFWKAGGGVGITYRPSWFSRMELGLGAKALSCSGACEVAGLELRFGPSLGFRIAKDTMVGGALTFVGAGTSLQSTLGSVSVSHSFGLLP